MRRLFFYCHFPYLQTFYIQMQKEETENAPLQIQFICRCWKTCHEWHWKQPNAKNKRKHMPFSAVYVFSVESFQKQTCLWVFQVSDIIADTVFCLIIIPVAGRLENLSDIWEIRLKDATEQSESNPWQRLGKVQQCHKILPERQYNRNAFTSCFLISVEILLNSMSLYLYVLAFGSHLGEVRANINQTWAFGILTFMTLLLSF